MVKQNLPRLRNFISASNRPRTWLIAYFTAMLAFARAYRIEIASFYHSTSKYEPSTLREHETIANLLQQALVDQIHANDPGRLTGSGDSVYRMRPSWLSTASR